MSELLPPSRPFRSLLRSVAVIAGVLLAPLNLHADTVAQDFYGLDAHLTKHDDYQAEIDDMIASGTKWARVGGTWGGMEKSRGVYDNAYLARLDDVIDRLTSHGINIVWPLAYTAPWASSISPGDPDTARYRPALWSDWENHVAFVTNRYKGKVKYWEVWNEQDYSAFWKSSLADYNTLLQKASAKIRAASPDNKVVLGGLALYNKDANGNGYDYFGPGTFFDQLLDLPGAAASFDIVNYHAYGDSARWFKLYDAVKANMQSHGIASKKIWITETGYSSLGTPAGELTKADRVDQTFIAHGAMPGVERIFWYVNRNVAPFTPANPSEENFGLTTLNRTPLKAMAFYQASGGALADFALQKSYPNQAATLRTLYYLPTTTGDGSQVQDNNSDGSVKRILADSYMYFRVNDNWIHDANGGVDTDVTVEVTYLDTDTGTFSLQYDGLGGAYTGLSKTRTGTGTWMTTTFWLNNVKFANRQSNASDLRLWAQGSDLVVGKVVMRRQMNRARIVLGANQRGTLIEQNVDNDPTHTGYAPTAEMGGEQCRKIESNNRYIHLRMCDGVARVGDPNVTFGVRFWDSGTDKLLIRYNAIGDAYKGVSITKTNTNTWRYVQVSVNDAAFNNAQSYYADFCIGNGWDDSAEYISRVDLTQRRATAVLGGIDRFRLINHPLDPIPANIGYAPWMSMGGVDCLQIQGDNKYLFFQVSEALADADTPNITFGVRFWDAGNDSLQIRYNAVGNANKGIVIPKTNTNAWRYVQVPVTDAAFNGSQSYFGDFCISNYGDGSVEYISGVDVLVNPIPGKLIGTKSTLYPTSAQTATVAAVPEVTILGKAKVSTTAPKYTLKGTASVEGGSVALVRVKVGKAGFKAATGTKKWKFKANLKPGKKKIVVVAISAAGVTSMPKSVTIRRF